ncbi:MULTISPECIES: Sir2 family NAD-dependent protein deacetylase [Achromobacter]|jgi:NAD-dependent deacetylase|uniref:protein acetyllysine N-acetyltransferase n=1 Tax=Achromobacter insuavis TaxID=1287735 RepID=A0A6J5AZC9_9BURK|nr:MULTISPECIES: Sir2 family NAD-dependent protein deacetylase [Achromobacter]CAB3684291.1 NAD-dependent protein deacylase Sir2 [Achromobacter insuavis]CUI90939.1 NAD-dependent deacetylase [Achromobacter sp. 2789STDY5608628]CUJ30517.1 NAD-dependent deacetylase [Achromobacter sp. 2789STDY5608633]
MKYRKFHLSFGLLNTLREAREVVVITGSGLGVASGLPASRDGIDGLWSQHDPGDLATAEGFRRDPASVWAWNSVRRVRASRAMPNAAHWAIGELAKVIPLMTVITQNGDNLHERAGTPRAIYLHGRLDDAWCPACGVPHVSQPYGGNFATRPLEHTHSAPPACRLCGAFVRPGRLWHGERPQAALWRTCHILATSANLVLTVGTSCQSPAAAELCYAALAAGAKLVQINPNSTSMDRLASHNLRGKAEILLPLLLAYAWPRT